MDSYRFINIALRHRSAVRPRETGRVPVVLFARSKYYLLKLASLKQPLAGYMGNTPRHLRPSLFYVSSNKNRLSRCLVFIALLCTQSGVSRRNKVLFLDISRGLRCQGLFVAHKKISSHDRCCTFAISHLKKKKKRKKVINNIALLEYFLRFFQNPFCNHIKSRFIDRRRWIFNPKSWSHVDRKTIQESLVLSLTYYAPTSANNEIISISEERS